MTRTLPSCHPRVLLLGLAAVACSASSQPAAAPQALSPAPAAPAEPAPTTPAATPPGPWWDEPYPQRFDAAALSKRLDVLRVQGNRFVDAKGATVVLQGVNISDPDKLERGGHYDRRLFEEIRAWGANVVRVPVHPVAWHERGKAAYFELLDRAVVWATELDLYLIIDWHSIGNLVTSMFQHPMYDTDQRETLEFWRSIAFRYADVPTVAFYELFNEPTVRRGTLGVAPWEQWKALNEELISIIFAHGTRPIPLVAGFDWAYQLGPIARQPIERENIGYVSHPYPGKAKAPYQQNWDEAFGFAASKYPLFITEMGYMDASAKGAHSPAIDDGTYGKRITDYLAEKGASWTAWCFDPDWPPQLISDWSFTPTASGAHFRQVMQARRASAPKH
jgi:aryl-phospho-beta-D-glucosidase BglC (GH1 family)